MYLEIKKKLDVWIGGEDFEKMREKYFLLFESDFVDIFNLLFLETLLLLSIFCVYQVYCSTYKSK